MYDNTQTNDSGKDSVEDGWKSEIVDYGVDEERAENIVSMLQSSTDLVLGNPSEDEVNKALRTAIENTDFEEYGAEQPDQLTDALLGILDEWQDGSRNPPVAAAPRRPPTDWEDNITGDLNEGNSVTTDREPDDTADETETEESVTTFQGDPIAQNADLGPHGAPEKEAMAGAAGPINDDQGVVKEAVNAAQEADSTPSSSVSTDTVPDEEQTEQQGEQSSETGADGSKTDVRRQKIDLAKAIAYHQFDQNEKVINSWTEQPAELVEDEITSFGTLVINVYRDMVKDALFTGMTDTEQELLYEKLVENRIREHIDDE